MTHPRRPKGPLHLLRPAPSTGTLRRARDARLGTFRAFGNRHGWRVVGLHEDLSGRYPVAPFVGARDARAELALRGRWQRWQGLVASVLVLPAASSLPRQGRTRDVVVQLAALVTGSDAGQGVVHWSPSGPHVLTPAGASPVPQLALEDSLQRALAAGIVSSDDELAWSGGEIAYARVLAVRNQPIDVEGPLTLLAELAAAIS